MSPVDRFTRQVPASTVSFRLRHLPAGSPRYPFETASSSCRPTVRLRLLPTPPHDDAVTFGYGASAYSDADLHRADGTPSRAHWERFSIANSESEKLYRAHLGATWSGAPYRPCRTDLPRYRHDRCPYPDAAAPCSGSTTPSGSTSPTPNDALSKRGIAPSLCPVCGQGHLRVVFRRLAFHDPPPEHANAAWRG